MCKICGIKCCEFTTYREIALAVGFLELILGFCLAAGFTYHSLTIASAKSPVPAVRIAMAVVEFEALIIISIMSALIIYGTLKKHLLFTLASLVIHLLYLIMHVFITIMIIIFGLTTELNVDTITGITTAGTIFILYLFFARIVLKYYWELTDE